MPHGPSRWGALVALVAAAGMLALTPPLFAQRAQFHGRVTDQNGQPVAGATIEITRLSGVGIGAAPAVGRGETWHTTTNNRGEYVIGNLPRGSDYLVIASKEGVGTGQVRVNATTVLRGIPISADLTLSLPVSEPQQGCAASADPTATPRTTLVRPINPEIARLVQWLELARMHAPGCVDAAVRQIGAWSQPQLTTLLADLGRLSRFLRRRSAFPADAMPQHVLVLHGQPLTSFVVQQLFAGNQTLKHGAVLHADIAALVGDNLGERPVTLADGQQTGTTRGSVHWAFGRKSLDLLEPSPGGDADALLWYRATSVYMIGSGNLADAPAHLDTARRIFPGHAVFFVDSAYLHEELASPAVQAAVQQMRASGSAALVDSRATEFERAARYYRQALALDPADVNARVRLGHTLGELSRHEDAATELRAAIDAQLTPRLRYLASLFLGRAEQALGHIDDSRSRFEEAAALYPEAQSPKLALSQLARLSGDRTAAARALSDLNTQLTDAVGSDPWWEYYKPYFWDANAALDQMRRIGRSGTP